MTKIETYLPRLLASASVLFLGACLATHESAELDWRPSTRADLNVAQVSVLGQFVDARDELFSSLFAELSGAVQASGHAEAIGVCQERAPAIASEVSAKHGVRIGRTSAKLRSPGNAAPEWAAPWLASGSDARFETRGNGELRALFPIRIAPKCLACHGKAEELADGVASALSQRYISDQATGYSEGDLRGWFWVEQAPEADAERSVNAGAPPE